MANVGDRVGTFNRDLSPFFQASEDLPELPTGLKDVDGSGYKKYDADIRAWWTNMRENLDRLQDSLVNYKILDLDEKHSDLNSDAITSLNAASIGLSADITNEATTAAAATAAVQADVDANEVVTTAHAADTANPHGVTASQVGAYTEALADSAISSAIAGLVDSAPTTLDTLNELAAALADDASFSLTVTNLIGANTTAIGTNTSAISTNATAIALNTTHRGLTNNPHGVTASDVSLGSASNHASIPTANLDTTATLGTDDTKVPSQNAVKTYVDNASSASAGIEIWYAWISVTGGGLYIRNWDTPGWSTVGGGSSVRLSDWGSGVNSVGGYGGNATAAAGAAPFQQGGYVSLLGMQNNTDCPFHFKTYKKDGSFYDAFGQIWPKDNGLPGDADFGTKAGSSTWTVPMWTPVGMGGGSSQPQDWYDGVWTQDIQSEETSSFHFGRSTKYPSGTDSEFFNFPLYRSVGGVGTDWQFGGVFIRIG